MAIEVTDAADRHRFEAHSDGELAGFIQYTDRPDALVLVHTEVLDAFEGRGIGSVLVRHVLDSVRSRDRVIIPTCPFVAEYIRRHPDYVDLIAEPYRAAFQR